MYLCVCVCMCTRASWYMYVCVRVYLCIHIRFYTLSLSHTHTQTCAHTNLHLEVIEACRNVAEGRNFLLGCLLVQIKQRLFVFEQLQEPKRLQP